MSDERKNCHPPLPQYFEKALREAEKRLGANKLDYQRPPWKAFLDMPLSSMGWRMGAGETFLDAFRPWFRSLQPENQVRFRNENPEPEGWEGFYDRTLYHKGKD